MCSKTTPVGSAHFRGRDASGKQSEGRNFFRKTINRPIDTNRRLKTFSPTLRKLLFKPQTLFYPVITVLNDLHHDSLWQEKINLQ